MSVPPKSRNYVKRWKGRSCFLVTADIDGLYIHCYLKRSAGSVQKKENVKVFVTNLRQQHFCVLFGLLHYFL